MTTMRMPFTDDDARTAIEGWGANCGPFALAFALQLGLEAARFAIPGFDSKRYTSPSMMLAAMQELGRRVKAVPATRDLMFADVPALVRIQWGGPWLAKGVNPKWRYCQTHWITTWSAAPELEGGVPMIFDANGGMQSLSRWEIETVPDILRHNARADGTWFCTDIWRVQQPAPAHGFIKPRGGR